MPEGITDPNYKPLPGRLGNLTVEQQHILDKFRKAIQEEGWFVPERMDDAMLLRFVSSPAPLGRLAHPRRHITHTHLLTCPRTDSCGPGNSTLKRRKRCSSLLKIGESRLA